MNHRFPRTERDLRALAVGFSAANIKNGLPERLECLAAYHRTVVEADKASAGQPHAYDAADREYATSIKRLRDAGVDFPEGEFTFSPCMGPDLPDVFT